MKRADQDQLDRLLARGRLSQPEKERLWGDIARAAKPSWRARFGWIGALRWAVPALAMLLLIPIIFLRRGTDEFHEKGQAAMAARIEVGCADVCRSGGVLQFRTGDVKAAAVLAAWAEDDAGHRIWYFPTDGGELPAVAPHAEMQTLARGARIGAEHAAGRYRITVSLLRPGEYTREKILANMVSRTTLPLEITK